MPKNLKFGLAGACQVALLMFASAAIAEVQDFEGVVGVQKIGMALAVPAMSGPIPPGPLKGHYFYTKYKKDIPLDGDVDKFGNVTLYERDAKGLPAAMFKGKIQPDIVKISGTWSRLDGGEQLPFNVTSTCTVGGGLDNRYSVAGVEMPQQAFESKVQAFVAAVARGDKNAVADMVAYPLRVNRNKKPREIKSKREFLSAYSQIFSPAFSKLVSGSETHDLFARDIGVMLGSGQVWFDAQGRAYVLNL